MTPFGSLTQKLRSNVVFCVEDGSRTKRRCRLTRQHGVINHNTTIQVTYVTEICTDWGGGMLSNTE